MIRLLITGASGYIGRRVIGSLRGDPAWTVTADNCRDIPGQQTALLDWNDQAGFAARSLIADDLSTSEE